MQILHSFALSYYANAEFAGVCIMYMNLYLYMYLIMYLNMYMYLYLITVVIIKSMRPAHERVNAPPFLGKISNRHFFKKILIFALDFSAGWDYI